MLALGSGKTTASLHGNTRWGARLLLIPTGLRAATVAWIPRPVQLTAEVAVQSRTAL